MAGEPQPRAHCGCHKDGTLHEIGQSRQKTQTPAGIRCPSIYQYLGWPTHSHVVGTGWILSKHRCQVLDDKGHPCSALLKQQHHPEAQYRKHLMSSGIGSPVRNALVVSGERNHGDGVYAGGDVQAVHCSLYLHSKIIRH